MKILGIIASVIIVISLLFKTRTYTGTVCMRCINLLGSVAFIIYAIWGIQDIPMMITNIAGSFINGYYLIREYFNHKIEVSYGRK